MARCLTWSKVRKQRAAKRGAESRTGLPRCWGISWDQIWRTKCIHRIERRWVFARTGFSILQMNFRVHLIYNIFTWVVGREKEKIEWFRLGPPPPLFFFFGGGLCVCVCPRFVSLMYSGNLLPKQPPLISFNELRTLQSKTTSLIKNVLRSVERNKCGWT